MDNPTEGATGAELLQATEIDGHSPKPNDVAAPLQAGNDGGAQESLINPAPSNPEIMQAQAALNAEKAQALAAIAPVSPPPGEPVSIGVDQAAEALDVSTVLRPDKPVLIPPSVSRFVWYRGGRDDGIPKGPDDAPLSAQICGVIDDETVNLAIMGFDGSGPFPRQRVRLVHEGPVRPGQCTWMPFQRDGALKRRQQ